MSGNHNWFTGLQIRSEGCSVYTEEELAPYKGEIETTYVERRIPVNLENKAHALLDALLIENGYNPEEI